MKKLLLLSSILSLSSFTYSFEMKMPTSYEVQYVQNFGKVNGFVQIPKGGQFGTTSERRPEFKELGIKNISYPEVKIGAKWDNFGTYFSVEYEHFKGNSTLIEDLKTHNIQLKKGDHISSKHRYAFYNLGFSYDYKLTNNFILTPKIEFSAFDFKYTFSASGSKNISNDRRSFHAGAIGLGGDVKYIFNKDFALTFNLMSHIPHQSFRYSLDTSLMASYNLYRAGNTEINLLAGVGYEVLKYRDHQKDMQNFIHIKTGPIYKAGLELKF